jgi:streptomycin 6-kinase
LVPLEVWFGPLLAGGARGEDFEAAANAAGHLLKSEAAQVSLHGDLHHHNVLDFGAGDWRAIDPKGLRGDRAFDFVHLLRNPDAAVSRAPGVLETRVALIAHEAGIGRDRLLAWTLAFSALSAIWSVEEDDCPADDLALLQRCRTLLGTVESVG